MYENKVSPAKSHNNLFLSGIRATRASFPDCSNKSSIKRYAYNCLSKAMYIYYKFKAHTAFSIKQIYLITLNNKVILYIYFNI